jgi:hypothetical protein
MELIMALYTTAIGTAGWIGRGPAVPAARWRLASGLLLGLLGGTLAAAEPDRVLELVNGGFEQGLAGWTVQEQPAISTVSEERSASGRAALHIRDDDGARGSAVASSRLPLPGAAMLDVRGKLYPVSGDGLGVYVRQYDAGGTCISGESHLSGLGGSERAWRPFALTFVTLPECAEIELYFHSYNAARVDAFLDDLQFVVRGLDPTPPWPASYKIRPTETARLTAADVIGPDGLVYPNWTRCGVDGGIPAVPDVVRAADYGALADDDRDDAGALERAAAAAGERGGGAVTLGAGVYLLDRPLTIRAGGVVLRGAGRERTRIVFRYALPAEGICFYTPKAGETLGRADLVEVHATPKDLQALRVSAAGTQVHEWKRSLHSGNTFWDRFGAAAVFKVQSTGRLTLKAEAEYSGGGRKTTEIEVELDAAAPARLVPVSSAAIHFAGGGMGPPLKLAEDGRRGSTELVLESAAGLARGDRILIDGPATERWKALTRNLCAWGSYRQYAVRVVAVNGPRLTLEQPLRLEFPIVDGSLVRKLTPIEWCGVEDMSIEQTQDLWISTVEFSNAWNCWVRGVRVVKTGRFPVQTNRGKWCEVRDCVFDDAWFKGGGGTAYTAWQNSWDCLMDGIETFNYRHAPLVQWAAAGCVIRNGVFHNSDGQWHAGWTNENLFENCVIDSRTGNGGYGYGLWASPPEDAAHGPNGPRNVVYNCDVASQKDGLWMGGMNENWLILYNRFVVDKGPGVFAKTASFDHIIAGNVFVLREARAPMLDLRTPDCSGVEALGNTVYGGKGQVCAGLGRLARDEGNAFRPAQDELPSRPAPAVPSIFQWQRDQVKWERQLPSR